MAKRLCTKVSRMVRSFQSEAGIEHVEWVAMAAVIALMLVGSLAILQPGGTQVGQTILDGMLKWGSAIGGSADGSAVAEVEQAKWGLGDFFSPVKDAWNAVFSSKPSKVDQLKSAIESKYKVKIEKGTKDWSQHELELAQTALGDLTDTFRKKMAVGTIYRDKAYKSNGKEDTGVFGVYNSGTKKLGIFDQHPIRMISKMGIPNSKELWFTN